MYDRARERLGDELWTALGLPTWEELSEIIPRQPSYGPADGQAKLLHGDLKVANLVIHEPALARVLERYSAGRPFFNALRDDTIRPLAEEALAHLTALRREHGDALAEDMFQRHGGLYELEYRQFRGMDSAGQLEHMVEQVRYLARADLEAGLTVTGQLFLARELAEWAPVLARMDPLHRLLSLSVLHAHYERVRSDRPGADTLPECHNDIERLAAGAVDFDLGLVTHNPRSMMMDLAVLIRLSSDWSQEEIESAYRERRGTIHRDELDREILDYAWRSVVNDIMRATEGRVPIEYAVNAVVDFRVRAGLVPWADEADRPGDADIRRRTRELTDEVTALLAARVDLHHPDKPLAPFRLPARLRDHAPPDHRSRTAPVVHLHSTRADRDEARRLSDGREPDAGLVAACAVRRYEHARTADATAGRAIAAAMRERLAAEAFRAYRRAFEPLNAYRKRNAIAQPTDVLYPEADARMTSRESTLDRIVHRANAAWAEHLGAAAEQRELVKRATRASVVRSWMRRLAPQSRTASADGVDRAVTAGLSPVKEFSWKPEEQLPRSAGSQYPSVTERLRASGLGATQDR
ncbi:MAG: hypothetical protein HOU01_11500 [Streptomycetaceae bacterium]|nr:hypothetical protein [Streptomycetaceae bacterium]